MRELIGKRVVVDVQHLYRSGLRALDRGTVYQLEAGGKVTEGDCAFEYGAALTRSLAARGAGVWTNDPTQGRLTGAYAGRQREATALGADLYLACHLNAGHGSYALAEYVSTGPWVTASQALGKRITDRLNADFPDQVRMGRTRSLSSSDRGFGCIQGFTRGPALVLEPLFGDHPPHQVLLTHPGLQALGESIAAAVAEFLVTKMPLTMDAPLG